MQLVGSGEVAYAVGFTGRIVRANADAGGNKYPLLWKTLLWSVDSWAVVKGSPNAAEGMKMIEWITDAKPLTALADDYAVSPANNEAAANPMLREKNPGMLSPHAADGPVHRHRLLGRQRRGPRDEVQRLGRAVTSRGRAARPPGARCRGSTCWRPR